MNDLVELKWRTRIKLQLRHLRLLLFGYKKSDMFIKVEDKKQIKEHSTV